MPRTRVRPAKKDNTPAAIPAKVGLRLAVARAAAAGKGGEPLRVLDAYAGSGRMWSAVRRHYHDRLIITSVDTRRFTSNIAGDNRRVIAGMDLSRFDVIDLDSYGVPGEQVKLVAEGGYRGPLIWTCILAGMGMVVTATEGIPAEWYRIAPTLVGGRDVDELRQRWCRYVSTFGWGCHGVLSHRRQGSSALYGVSSVELQVVTPAALTSAIMLYERHTDQMGQLDVEPDDRVHEDLRGM
jgi:hypothetical protein